MEPRILSLLPSATEIVGALGWAECVVGITHECDVCPDGEGLTRVLARGVERVTTSHIDPHSLSQQEIDTAVSRSLSSEVALYALDRTALERARPTVVLTQALCSVCAPDADDVDALCEELSAVWAERPTVLHLEPTSLLEVAETFVQVAAACGDASRGERCKQQFLEGFATLREVVKRHAADAPRLLMLEWLDPPFDGGHWVPGQIEAAGAVAVSNAEGGKSARLTWDAVQQADPDVIAVACCGFGLERNRQDALSLLDPNNVSDAATQFRALRAVREGRVFALDGNRYFARPAPSLLEGAAQLALCAHHGNVSLRRALHEKGLVSETTGAPLSLTDQQVRGSS